MVGIFTKSSKSLKALQRGLNGVVSIEGNVGAGKSSLIRALNAKGYFVNEEPVDEWASFLPMFLADRKRWTMTFQLQCMNRFCITGDLFEKLNDHKNKKVKFVERSANAALLFAKHGLENGELSDWEYDLLKQRMKMCFQPEYSVYLQTPPVVAFARKNMRNRDGEENTGKEYIESLHELHEEAFNNGETKTLVLPAQGDSEELADRVIEWTKEMEAKKRNRSSKCHPCPKELIGDEDENGLFRARVMSKPMTHSDN